MKKIYYILSLSVLMALHADHLEAQIITTIAGNGTAGYLGTGTSAILAELDHPKGTAIDDSGYVYIADADNNVIRRIDLAGNITTIAGYPAGGFSGDSGLAIYAGLSRPNSVAIDYAGNIFICDADNQRVRKINTAGIITTIAGNGTAGYNGDGGRADTSELNYPGSVAVDKYGNVYIADEYNNRIRKVDTFGIITTVAGNGATGYSGAGGSALSASIPFPFGVAVDTGRNIYFSLTLNDVICKVDNTGTLITVGGTDGVNGSSGDGGPATAALFDTPWGIAVDRVGNLYISDNANQRIRMVNTSGTVNTFAGTSTGFFGDNGPATSAKLRDPAGVSADATGNIYIADYNNHRIRKVSIINHAPYFTNGASNTISVCSDSVSSINTSLSVVDSDNAQLETWGLVSAPAHGTLASSYGTFSTGSTLTPSGLSYTSMTGYTGSDTFKIRVSDGIAADTITMYVTVTTCTSTLVNAANAVGTGNIQLYPNPNNGTFTLNITSPVDEKVSVVITNIVGEKVKELTAITNTPSAIDLSAPAGIYFINVATAHKQFNQKIIVAK